MEYLILYVVNKHCPAFISYRLPNGYLCHSIDYSETPEPLGEKKITKSAVKSLLKEQGFTKFKVENARNCQWASYDKIYINGKPRNTSGFQIAFTKEFHGDISFAKGVLKKVPILKDKLYVCMGNQKNDKFAEYWKKVEL